MSEDPEVGGSESRGRRRVDQEGAERFLAEIKTTLNQQPHRPDETVPQLFRECRWIEGRS